MRILLVEDDRRLAELIASTLRGAEHVVVSAATLAAATNRLDNEHFDALVLDIGLPDGSGLELCRVVRREQLDLAILVLTARLDVEDRVMGLDAGADDYLTKPFSTAELLARLRALARRGSQFREPVQHYGKVVVDYDRRQVICSEERVPLTPREFDIVAQLAQSDGRVVSRARLTECVWGDMSESASSSLEVLVARIRRKLAIAGQEGSIRTLRGVGYAWELKRSKSN